MPEFCAFESSRDNTPDVPTGKDQEAANRTTSVMNCHLGNYCKWWGGGLK
jgi:hypothetical protein